MMRVWQMNQSVNRFCSNVWSSVWFEVVAVLLACAVIVTTMFSSSADWKSLTLGRLEQVRLEGDYKHLDRLELEEIFNPALGSYLLGLDLLQFEKRLRHFPWVKQVVITRVLPDSLVVQIEERQAVARWKKQGLVDQDGEVFFPEDTEYPGLPIFVTEKERNAGALAFYHQLTRVFQVFDNRISYLIEDPSYSWKVGFKEGFVITLGRHDIEQRVHRFVKAYHAGLYEVKDYIQCIDLRHPDGFSVRWKDKKEKRGRQFPC